MNAIAMLTACMQRQDPMIHAEYVDSVGLRPDVAPPGANAEGILPPADYGVEGAVLIGLAESDGTA